MGFFSWQCKGCDESIKAPYGLSEDVRWKNKVVMLMPNGTCISGDYDGYGRIHQPELTVEIDAVESLSEFWHSRCYSEANGPAYTSPSDSALDQGYFDGDPLAGIRIRPDAPKPL